MEWSEALTHRQYNLLVDQGLKALQQFATWAAGNICEEEIGMAWAPGNEYLVVRNGKLYLKIDKSVSVDRESKPGEPPKPQYDYEKISAEKLVDMVKEFKLTPTLLEEAKKKIEKELAKKNKMGISGQSSAEDWQRTFEELEGLIGSPAISDLRRWIQIGKNQTHTLLLTEKGLLKVDKNTPIMKRKYGTYTLLPDKIAMGFYIDEFNLKAEALAEIRRRLET